MEPKNPRVDRGIRSLISSTSSSSMPQLRAMETSEKSPSPPFQSSSILPDDLLRRVFSLLPLKSLFRLRCLCKLWRSLPFSLIFAETVVPSSPLLHHFWLLSFRLLARKVNEYRSSTYKATMYTYSIAYDREMMGSSGYALQLPLGDAGSDHTFLKRYEILDLSSPLATLLKTGILDIVASVNGLFLLTLRLSKVHDHEENNLKVFVYNPISKDVRSLPATRYAPQKLSMTLSRDEKGISGYRVYSLGRSYRPGTKYLLYSMEVFDSAEACNGWSFLSHVRANVSGSGDLHPGNEIVMGYVNSKSISNDLGFLYWMPCLDYRSSTGRHSELSSCHMTTGFLCGMHSLPFKTTFVDMWPCPSGIKLVCGVAQGDDFSCTCGVEVWELVQGEGGFPEDDHFYGVVEHLSLGTYWQPRERMPQDLWDHLTRKSTCRVASIVCSSLVLVVAEKEEEHMVVYDTNDTTWKLAQLWPLLQDLFQDKHSEYYCVYPWIINFTPNASALV